MATVEFRIGHKEYSLSCQEGEEKLLRRAAGMLDAEARQILEQVGRVPEPRLLLLAGLMLADRAVEIAHTTIFRWVQMILPLWSGPP